MATTGGMVAVEEADMDMKSPSWYARRAAVGTAVLIGIMMAFSEIGRCLTSRDPIAFAVGLVGVVGIFAVVGYVLARVVGLVLSLMERWQP